MIAGRRRILIGGGAAAAVVTGAAWAGLHGMASMAGYDASLAASRAVLTANPDLQELVRFATLAPNGHNTQPWRFRIEADRIELLPDLARRTPVVDPDDHHIFVGLGCAAENLVLAAAATRRVAETELAVLQNGSIAFRFRSGKPTESTLFTAIPHRQSARGGYDGKAISTADLCMLADAAEMPGVQTILITKRKGIDRVRDLVLAGNTAQMNDTAFIRELKQWLRYNPRDAMQTGDGLFSVASGTPALPSWAGPLFFDRLVTAETENKRYASQNASSAGVAVFVGASAAPRSLDARGARVPALRVAGDRAWPQVRVHQPAGRGARFAARTGVARRCCEPATRHCNAFRPWTRTAVLGTPPGVRRAGMTIGNLGLQVGASHSTERLRADPKGELGVSRNDFAINFAQQRATCPAGKMS